MLLVPDRNSGTHNLNQKIPSFVYDLGDVIFLWLLIFGQHSNVTSFVAVFGIPQQSLQFNVTYSHNWWHTHKQ